jgi:hypothetical protein
MKDGFLILLTTLFIIRAGCARSLDGAPSLPPETTPVAPDLSPSEPSGYPIRIRILTASNWTTLRLANGAEWVIP